MHVSCAMEKDDGDYLRSPKKKRCPRKVERCFPIVSGEEITEISEVFVPTDTKRNTQWALSCFVSGEVHGTMHEVTDNNSALLISLRILWLKI